MYKVLKWHFPRKRHVDRGNWSDFSQLYGFRCFHLGVFILKNAIIVHHFLQFQVLVLEDWLQTVQVRVTADAIWPVCLEIRILCEHKRGGSWNDERVFIFERSSYYCAVLAGFFFATLINYFPGANKYPSSHDAAQSTTLQVTHLP